MDVRGNPGGYLQSVEDILKHFMTKDHPYIQIAERNGDKKQYFSKLKEKNHTLLMFSRIRAVLRFGNSCRRY